MNDVTSKLSVIAGCSWAVLIVVIGLGIWMLLY
jgi:hypothetical protein